MNPHATIWLSLPLLEGWLNYDLTKIQTTKLHIMMNRTRLPAYPSGWAPVDQYGYLFRWSWEQSDNKYICSFKEAASSNVWTLMVARDWAVFSILPVAPPKDPHYPDVCPRCKGPAYIGAVPAALDCKAKCR